MIWDWIFYDQGLCEFCLSQDKAKWGLCSSCVDYLEAAAGEEILESPRGATYQVHVPYFYNNFLKEAFSRYKFEKVSALEDTFGQMLVDFFQEKQLQEEVSWITYIPMRHQDEVLRAYNPAKRLARFLAQAMKMPLVHCLEKTKKNQEQNKISREERQANVKGVFAPALDDDYLDAEFYYGGHWQEGQLALGDLYQKKGIVLDDFLTTGSTLLEAFAVLEDMHLSCQGLALAMMKAEEMTDTEE